MKSLCKLQKEEYDFVSFKGMISWFYSTDVISPHLSLWKIEALSNALYSTENVASIVWRMDRSPGGTLDNSYAQQRAWDEFPKAFKSH